jgi:hypothetical protein
VETLSIHCVVLEILSTLCVILETLRYKNTYIFVVLCVKKGWGGIKAVEKGGGGIEEVCNISIVNFICEFVMYFDNWEIFLKCVKMYCV